MKKHVLFFIQNFSRGAGSERATALAANYLASRGYRVSVLSICGDNTCFYPLEEGISLHTLFPVSQIDNRRNFLATLRRYRRFLREHDVDVCIDVFASLSIYTILLKRLCGVRNITWEHYNFFNNTGMSKLGRRFAARWSDFMVVLTKSDLELYVRNFPAVSERIECIYNPTPYQEVAALPSSRRKKVLLAVGRLTGLKRFDRAIEVWSRLEERHPEWSLWIVGEGELRESLESQIGALGLRRASLRGQERDMASLYETASILVSTSETEGLPMTMIEAQSFGVPIVSLDYYSGPRDIITPGIDGLIACGETEREQLDAMTVALDRLMGNPEKLDEMMHNAKTSSSRFLICDIGRRWDKVLEKVLGE